MDMNDIDMKQLVQLLSQMRQERAANPRPPSATSRKPWQDGSIERALQFMGQEGRQPFDGWSMLPEQPVEPPIEATPDQYEMQDTESKPLPWQSAGQWGFGDANNVDNGEIGSWKGWQDLGPPNVGGSFGGMTPEDQELMRQRWGREYPPIQPGRDPSRR
jgi:hypothetical protein